MYKKLAQFDFGYHRNDDFKNGSIVIKAAQGVYCPICSWVIEKAQNNENCAYYGGEQYICSKCGFRFLTTTSGAERSRIISRETYRRYLNGGSIYYDEERHILKYFVSKTLSVPTPKFLKWETTYSMLIIDMKKHVSYIISPKDYFPIRNVNNSYDFHCLFDNYSRPEINKAIRALAQIYMSFTPQAENVIAISEEITLEKIIRDNAYGFLGKDIAKIKSIPKAVRKYIPKERIDKFSFINSFVKENNLPMSKSFKRLYYLNITYVFQTLYLKNIGFNNPDNILKLLKVCAENVNKKEYIYNDNRKLIKKMIKARGENIVCRNILNADLIVLHDTISMYEEIMDKNKNLIDKSMYMLSINKAHDLLSSLYSSLKYENKLISYSKTQKNLKDKIGSICFELPKDTNTLVLIGEAMGICVGSYRKKVLSKCCTIVTMKDNDKYVGCIEINKKKKLVQVKGKFNDPLPVEYKEIFIQWCKNNKIQYENNDDFQNIGDRNMFGTYHDYHRLELVDGRVVDRYAG